jgi:hypothetical protein
MTGIAAPRATTAGTILRLLAQAADFVTGALLTAGGNR